MSVSIRSRNLLKSAASQSLSARAAGDYLEVLSIDPELSCAARLRELCILEGQHIRLIRRHDPLLLDVSGSLVAIDLETAARIEVRDASCS